MAEHVRAKGRRLVSASAVFRDLQDVLSVNFADEDLLRLALTHPSYSNENTSVSGNNERLEFLGDAVLGLVIAERLYESFPDVEEGRLTLWRAHLVQGSMLSRVSARLDLGRWLLLGIQVCSTRLERLVFRYS